MIGKVPMKNGKTLWNVKEETMQGLIGIKGPGDWFGFEEYALE